MDTKFDPPGARGIGEIGTTGAAGAVANAIYHAAGQRIRAAPITPDMLMTEGAERKGRLTENTDYADLGC